LISKPFGPRKGSTQGARKSQKPIVSPPKIISPENDLIKYLPSPVGPCADATFVPKLWSRTKKVKAMKHVAGKLKLKLAQFAELKTF
jgi:hypothetical protein